VDGAGNIYLADTDNHTIRKVTPSGAVSTFAGRAGVTGAADGPAKDATFDTPTDVATDAAGNIYVADTLNHAIRKISAAGDVTTVAGQPGAAGAVDGWAAARFFGPQGVALDAARGVLYVADTLNHAVRKITLSHGGVVTLAGRPGEAGGADGAAGEARFNAPSGLATDTKGNVYVADTDNHAIRAIAANGGGVTTLAGQPGEAGAADGTGTAARFNQPSALAVDPDGKKLYALDTASHTVRQVVIATGAVGTIAGLAGASGDADGIGDAARFNAPSGLAMSAADGLLYLADTGNHTLRAGHPAQAVQIITQPRGLTVQAGEPAEFTVVATGWPQPLTYQWYCNGESVPGATGVSLRLDSVPESATGDTYTVVVTNPLGSVTSIGAYLSVSKRIYPPSSSQAGSGGGAPGALFLAALALLLAIKTKRD
jgi:DNA-binding beta-propeller fold protein YncE